MYNCSPQDLWDRQYGLCQDYKTKTCIGVDEAGRGALAGPVVAAAVCFHPSVKPFFVDDSKKLSEAKREKVFDEICSRGAIIGIAFCESDDIDRCNILQATLKAMKDACVQCYDKMNLSKSEVFPSVLAIDGNSAFSFHDSCPSVCIVHGDALLAAIAAASVVAKVSRDRLMKKLHLNYPKYAFTNNKGYGTAQHIEAIRLYGKTPVHRSTFLIRSLNERC